jgi:ATP-dependent Clp protease ATP-binding subunit ClpX
MKRSVLRAHDKTTSVRKSNIILMGGTGCGKTYLVKCIADYMKVPCYIQDCTKITASGYVGSDVEDCLGGLLRSCNYDLEKAKHGIVVLDEIDKNAVRSAGPSITRGPLVKGALGCSGQSPRAAGLDACLIIRTFSAILWVM